VRVGQWLEHFGIKTITDIGSGAGKFCVAAAIASPGCSFTGIEQRPRLVTAARSLARLFGVEDRVRFVSGVLGRFPVPETEAYYLFNPFGENLFGPDEHLDADVEMSSERYERDIASARRLFEHAREGTYVVKYNGFGARMPASYEQILVDREQPNVLRLWRKKRSQAASPTGGGEASSYSFSPGMASS
jgi:predicted RNA methylase